MSESSFENRLLLELRALVAEAPAGTPAVASSSRRRQPRLAVLAGAVAVVAVSAAAGIPLLSGGTTPAYAVSRNQDGSVTVEVASLKDAAGLEQKLREAGIPAVVQYLPPGKACEQPWPGTAAPPPDGEQGLQMMGVESSGGRTTFTIDGHIPAGRTLVIATQVGPATGLTPPGGGDASAIAVSWVQGEVAACHVVDAPASAGPLGMAPPPRAVGSLRTP